MLTQGEIERIPLIFQGHMAELENRIMADLISRLEANREITSTADWRIDRLYQLGESKKEIKKAIQENLKLSQKEIKKLYHDSLHDGYIRNEDLYREKGKKWLSFEKNIELQKLIAAVEKQTYEEFKNITRSLGFAIKGPDGRIVQSPIKNIYRDILDHAMMDISSGAFDYNTVLKRTIQTMTNSGLRSIDYNSGRSYRVDTAARMCVMTGFNQVQAKINEQLAHDLDTDYYEVSWHIGARPSHQRWQGKVYSYAELQGICGLGSAGGLCGVNCYHSYNAFIPGISVRTYTDGQLDALNREENTPIKYREKDYTRYEALQQQRKMERLMRKQRQDIKLLQTGEGAKGDILAAQSRYRATMDEYVKFSQEMNLPQQKGRIFQDGLGHLKTAVPLKNASGKSIVKASKTTLEGMPNSITQIENAKGGIDRNYYNGDGKQNKQISNNNHGKPKAHPYGKNGEHAHDYTYDADGNLIERSVRELTDSERRENDDIL